LKEVGWTKGLELAKLARRDRQHFDCATWLNRAREMPKEQCEQEVEKKLTGRDLVDCHGVSYFHTPMAVYTVLFTPSRELTKRSYAVSSRNPVTVPRGFRDMSHWP
jgi:hypothetical protein